MKKQIAISLGASLLAVTVALPPEVSAQGIGEFTGMQALGIGMGAGFAAVDRGKLAKYAHNSTVQVQQSIAVQTKAIEQYYAMGNKFEADKQWENAEKYFVCCLQMIAKRDGPGSVKSVPTLRHLATVNASQNKLDQATSYEKTVLAFTKAGKHPDKEGVLKESVGLSNLLVKSAKYTAAEPILKDSIEVANAGKIKTPDYRDAMRMYGLVLKELKKPEEAAKVEAQLAAEATVGTATSTPIETATPQAQDNAAQPTEVSANSTAVTAPQTESQPVSAARAEIQTATGQTASSSAPEMSPASQAAAPSSVNNAPAPAVSAPTTGGLPAILDSAPSPEAGASTASNSIPPASAAPSSAAPSSAAPASAPPVSAPAASAPAAENVPTSTAPTTTMDESTK